MKNLKLPAKKPNKHDRERNVLIGLVEYFIRSGKPVGSSSLKEAGFENLSSATIRNYFAHLEDEGYLVQQHISGGRIPTAKAYRFYAEECLNSLGDAAEETFMNFGETRTITPLLQQAAEKLAALSNTAVFLSAPRFDHDFITSMKLIPIDTERCLCVLITDFGEICTEVLHTEQKIGTISARKIEAFFNARLTGQHKPDFLTKHEEELAQKLYSELLVRYIAGYSKFGEEDIYRTGLSSLLSYPEFQDPATLSNGLSLFENTHGIRLLLKECAKKEILKYWIGSDLTSIAPQAANDCAVIAIPFRVNRQPVGAVALFGPLRLPYGHLFKLLRAFSDEVSNILTRSLYKFKITLRQPKQDAVVLKTHHFIDAAPLPLLEDKRGSSQKPSKTSVRRQR